MRNKFSLLLFFMVAFFALAQLALGQSEVGNGGSCIAGQVAGNGTCASTVLFPAIAWPTPAATPYVSSNYAVDVPPLAISTASGVMYVGFLDGDTCVAQIAVANTYPATPAPTQTLTPTGDQEICTFGNTGSTADLAFTPSNDFGHVPESFTKTQLNGVVQPVNGNFENNQWRLPRTIGTTYTATTYNGGTNNGLIYSFAVVAPSQATAVANAAAPYRPETNYFGAFAREDGGAPPFGMVNATNPNISPSPYPAPTSSLFGSSGYCDEVATNGYSIATGQTVDYLKIWNMVALGVQWARTGPDPFFDDNTHNPNAGFYWLQWDALQCALLRNNITPMVNIGNGPVIYGPTFTGNVVYKSPADYAAFCSAVATHEHQIFTTVTRFSIPGNEQNGGFSDVSLTNNSTLYAGDQGVALYSQACYQAIKNVNPNYIVYWGEVNMDPSANPYTYITDMYKYGCQIGSCFDALSIHLSTGNDPLAQYDYTNQGWQTSDTITIAAINAITKAMNTAGETRPIHFILGESAIFATVPSTGGMFGNTGDQAYGIARLIAAVERIPVIDGLNLADIDECSEYAGTAFANECIVPDGGTPSTANAAYAVIQPFTGVTPAAAPTPALNTVPIAFVQTPVCGTASTIAFTAAPANGDVVSVLQFSAGGGIPGTVNDSNGLTYTQRETPTDSVGGFNYLVDANVSGTPTKTYSYSTGGANIQCQYDISSTTVPATYQVTNTGSSGSTVVATIAGVQKGDALVCGVLNESAHLTSVVISNGSNTTDLAPGASSNQRGAVHSIASSTASTTCTANMAATGSQVVLVFGDY